MAVFVSVATYNESPNIEALLQGILEHSPEANVIVVDDDSPDGTGDIVDRIAAADPRVLPVHRPRKSGYASAHKQAIAMAMERGATAIVTMDADFSHDPAVIPQLTACLDAADIAIGSRYVKGGGVRDWPWHRRALSAGANLVTRVLLGIPAHDCTSGFRAYRPELVRRLNLDGFRTEGYAFLEESLFECNRMGARIAEVPIIFRDRQLGKSKLSQGVVMEAIRNVFALAWRRLRGKG